MSIAMQGQAILSDMHRSAVALDYDPMKQSTPELLEAWDRR